MSTVITTPPSEAPRGGVAKSRGLFDREILRQAFAIASARWIPVSRSRNPVMFIVLVGS